MSALSESRIDRRQLRALLLAAWKTDLRGSGNPVAPSGDGSRKIPPVLAVMALKLFIGLGLGAMVFIVREPFTAAFLVFSTMTVFLAITVLLEFSNLILRPDEHLIIAALPVGSKTFFAAKMIHLLAYVNVLGSLICLPPAITSAVANRNPLLLPGFLIAGVLAATAMGLSFVLLYALLLRIVDREAMQRVLGYANLALTLVVYLGYFVAPMMLGGYPLSAIPRLSPGWIYLAPPAWFAAVVKLLAGEAAPVDIGASLFALVLIAVVFRAAMSKLSLEYAETLFDTIGRDEPLRKRGGSGRDSRLLSLVAASEDRAVWMLIRKQFKYDNRFKTSILSILPLTAIYVFLAVLEGGVAPDPFLAPPGDAAAGGYFLLYIAAALFPYMITFGTVNSDSYRSAWVFYASPADRTRIILSPARYALVWFCLPFTLLLAGIFTWYFGSALHAVLHCLVIYAILVIQTRMLTLMYPRIPFSQPPKTGQRTLYIFVLVTLSIIVMCVPMGIVTAVGYGGYAGYSVWLGGAMVINGVLSRIIRRTIPRRAAGMEFLAPV